MRLQRLGSADHVQCRARRSLILMQTPSRGLHKPVNGVLRVKIERTRTARWLIQNDDIASCDQFTAQTHPPHLATADTPPFTASDPCVCNVIESELREHTMGRPSVPRMLQYTRIMRCSPRYAFNLGSKRDRLRQAELCGKKESFTRCQCGRKGIGLL